MDRDTQAVAYEVRCLGCDCSFAPGTKQCIHCGARIGRPVRIDGLGTAQPDEDEGAEMGSPTFLRGALWAVTAIVAMIMTAVRACQGG